MKRIALFYATRHGQAKRISEHIAVMLRSQNFECNLVNVRQNPEQLIPISYDAVLIVASVHLGKHESEMVRFVKKNNQVLQAIPSAFLSVSLSAAGLERAHTSHEENAQFASDVQKVLNAFFKETGWYAQRVKPVAGALLYSKYNWIVRFIMKRIAQKTGGDTDTSRDYEYTDWVGLDRFVTEFTAALTRTAA